MSHPARRTHAVVIDVRDHGESDKIVTCYCPEPGRLAGIAKGAKRSKKRFVNKLELFSLLELDYVPGRTSSLVRIDQAELLTPFASLRSRYDRYTAGVLLCELMLHWTRDSDSDPPLFALLVWALDQLDRGAPPLKTTILFHLRLLERIGYRPHLAGCLACRSQDAADAPYRFSVSRGGLVCASCYRDEAAASVPLSLNTAKLLAKAQELPQDKLERLRFSNGSEAEALELLKRYNARLLQRELQTWDLLAASIAASKAA